MSTPSDANIPLYDSESALSRDSLDAGNDSVSSLYSPERLSSAASQSVGNSIHHGPPSYHPAPNSAQYGQVASPIGSAVSRPAGGARSQAGISWWWWWEICGALLSIICVGLILAVLFKANDLALAAWPLWIQPNSLIAVFTTVGKSAMMVPIASCISQLKWRHFEQRANRLNHLQLLDEASRGPWGSLMLLADARIGAYIARALAVISLVSLGFDPSAQQILDFPTRETRLTNTSASIGVATLYKSKALVEDTDGSTGRFDLAIEWNQDLFKLQSSIIDGISGSVFQPAYSCPGEHCSWPDFTTLGVCGEFLNLTDTVEVNCIGSYDDQQNCSYRFPVDVPINSYYLAPYVLNVSYAEQVTRTSKPTTIFASRGDIGVSPGLDSGIDAAVLFAIKMVNSSRASLIDVPQVEAYYSTWYWCEKSYHNLSADPARISDADFTSEMLSRPNGVSNEQGIDGADYLPLIANSTGHTFRISATVNNALFPYLYKLLTRDIVDSYPHAGSKFDDDSLDLSTFLYTTDIKNVTENIAKTLTNQVRSLAPGDNSNATTFAGDVFVKEVYIRVTWPWLIIPVVETLTTAIILVYCIVLSIHHRLLKTSIIALLVHGLEGWGADEINIPDDEDAEKLETMAKGMKAKFAEDSDGRLRFFKA